MITLMSWGMKYGEPPANFKFDVSYLKNPWREGLKGYGEIMHFMNNQKEFQELLKVFVDTILCYNELYPHENLVFAFCCSAGEFRSPVMVECIGAILKPTGINYQIIQNQYSRL